MAWARIVFPLAIFAIVFIAFIPALSGEFLNWDDDKNFTQNEFWRGLGPAQIGWMCTSFHQGHYQPLTWLTLGLNFEIAGMKPWVYHLTNNLLHAMNAVLVLWLAVRLIGIAVSGQRSAVSESAGINRQSSIDNRRSIHLLLTAAVAALLWGVHPLRVESVAWITERRDLVSGLFILLTLLAYLRYAAARERRRVWYAMVIALFVLSLLGKVIGVTLPLVMLILDWYPLRRFQKPQSTIAAVVTEKVPLLLIALIFGGIVAYFDHDRGWIMPMADHPMTARLGQVMYGLIYYAEKTLAPIGLIPLRELERPINPLAGKFLLCAVIVLVSAALLLVFRKKVPALLAAALAYAILLGPTLGLVQTGPQMVADRYSYLPGIGWAIVAGGALTLLSPRMLRLAFVPAAAIILTLSIATTRQCKVWRDSFTLWQYTCATKNANSTYAWLKYGMLLNERGRYEDAEHAFRRSVEVDERHAKAHFLLGNMLYRRGLADEALQAFAESVKRDPRPFEPYYNAAFVLMKQGRLDEAAGTFQEALKRAPWDPKLANKNFAEAHANLGIVLWRMNRRDEAEEHLREAVRLEPSMQATVDQLKQPVPAATQSR